MASDSVIERFNVIEDIGAGQLADCVDPFSDALFCQRTEELFGYRIIPTVATSAHTGGQVVSLAEALHTAIINASIASSREREGFINQPTTLRAKRLMTTAKSLPPARCGYRRYRSPGPDLAA